MTASKKLILSCSALLAGVGVVSMLWNFILAQMLGPKSACWIGITGLLLALSLFYIKYFSKKNWLSKIEIEDFILIAYGLIGSSLSFIAIAFSIQGGLELGRVTLDSDKSSENIIFTIPVFNIDRYHYDTLEMLSIDIQQGSDVVLCAAGPSQLIQYSVNDSVNVDLKLGLESNSFFKNLVWFEELGNELRPIRAGKIKVSGFSHDLCPNSQTIIEIPLKIGISPSNSMLIQIRVPRRLTITENDSSFVERLKFLDEFQDNIEKENSFYSLFGKDDPYFSTVRVERQIDLSWYTNYNSNSYHRAVKITIVNSNGKEVIMEVPDHDGWFP